MPEFKGARFTAGDTMKTTHTTTPPPGQPQHKANTMKGMPGRINTAQKRDSSDTLTGKGFGPHREGPVGQKGGAHRANHGAAQARGSQDKSYKATSTAKPGTYAKGMMESLKGRAKTSWEK